MKWVRILSCLAAFTVLSISVGGCAQQGKPAAAAKTPTAISTTFVATRRPTTTPGPTNTPIWTRTPRPTATPSVRFSPTTQQMAQVAPSATMSPTAKITATQAATATGTPQALSGATRPLPAAPGLSPTAVSTAPAQPKTAPPAPAGAGRIFFAQGSSDGSDLALLDVATGKISVIAPNGRQPDVASDGEIVFAGAGNGRNNLWAIRPDGNGLRQVSTFAEDRYPSWEPYKRAIIYSTAAGGPERLSLQRDVTGPQGDSTLKVESLMVAAGSPVSVFGAFPTWIGPNRIAFSGCDVWTDGSRCGIWEINVDSWRQFAPFQLTANPGERPNDSANGVLLYSSAIGGNWDIHAINTAPPARKIDPNPTPRNLTNNPAQDVGATFSPDGRRIAFMSDRGGSWGIWVMNADGSNPTRLAPVPGGFGAQWDQERLSWAP